MNAESAVVVIQALGWAIVIFCGLMTAVEIGARRQSKLIALGLPRLVVQAKPPVRQRDAA